MKIDDKFTFYYSLDPDDFSNVSPKASVQYHVYTFSKSPYSLRNINLHDTSTTTKTNRKIQKLKLSIKLLYTIPLPLTLNPPLPTVLPPDILYQQSLTPRIY